MDNHQHEKHIDPAQARMNRKCIRQHKVDDQPHHIVHAHVRYSDLGDQLMQCSHCNANMWYDERISKRVSTTNPTFNLCCGGGKVELPLLQNPPKYLHQLLYDHDTSDSKNYQQNIRTYNIMFTFTSTSIKFDKSINHSRGPPTIRIQGQPCHRIGSMLPMPGKEPQFAQLYIFDTENEVQNRINAVSPHNQIQAHIVSQLSEKLDEYNAILMQIQRDIIIETQHGQLQRIHELHSSYLALQYPLLFPYREDGYRPDILHSSTPGSKKRKRNRLTMRDHVGFPNLFITLIYNPNWPEIHRLLNPLNLKATDRPDIISRVFKLKYEQMLMDLTKNQMVGKGMPHVHLLLVLHPGNKYPSSNEIYQIISPEIPSQQDDPELHSLCSRFYPKMFQPYIVLDADGYLVYRRRNNGHTIHKNGVIIDNRYIVPYNPRLLRKYQAHINVEWCNQSTSIKYLFKYINKGYDRVTVVLIHDDNDPIHNGSTHNDEIKEYLDCRYICPCESTWRIFGFPIHGKKPVVERLQFHLPGQHNVVYEDHDDIDDVLSKTNISDSKFISWMNINQNFVEGRSLTYVEFVSKFVYSKKKRCWQLRKKGYTIGRLLWDLRAIGNVQYPTYREACFAMGLLQDDKEFIEAIKEAKDWGSAHYKEAISLQLDDRTLQNLVLLEIEQLLQTNQRSLTDYPSMPYPEDANCPTYLLILAELNYNNAELISEFEHLFSHMTDEQASIYNQIVEVVNKDEGGMFFLYGYRGIGKTYIWKTLASSLKADNKIVIMVASSGITSLLLHGGRTAHSKLVLVFEDSTCNIHQGTQLVELLNQKSLIIWDEAPMAHKFYFEALDHSLRDIIKHNSTDNKIFGGKVMVFGGDFRQILPVIPRGSHSDIANAKINSSYLWDHCQVLRLTKNMRLQNNMQATDQEEIASFAQWIIDIGDGIIGHDNDGYATIEIPQELLIIEYNDPIHSIVSSTFPDLCHHHNDPEYFQSKAILASINETIQQVNDYILTLIPGEQMEYPSSDSVDKSETIESCHFRSLITEFLNSLITSGLPNHCLTLKIGTPIMLLRNLDQTQGLCNNTRLIVTRLAQHVIAADIISVTNVGGHVYIPGMSMSPSQSPWTLALGNVLFP
uniref:ATP-dependent DNA helicase n=1 Tax=Glycine max TaxID=3847 RepID=A0A0R0HRU7_SOYBN